MKTLQLVEFIKNNPDWKDKLQAPPYCISIREDVDFVLLKYNQTPRGNNPPSDMSLDIVKECRGIILDAKTFSPVCVPFFKFFNLQEENADAIDWSTARVQEKLDGSIIKLWWWDGFWHVSTNGTISAENAELMFPHPEIKDYFDLWMKATEELRPDFYENLDKSKCYMFELTSPYNKIVIHYEDTKIWHIGTRDMKTLAEEDLDIGIGKPKQYALSSVQDCMLAVSRMGEDEEGFVVVDAKWNRIKIKSPKYVLFHKMKGDGALTEKGILQMIEDETYDDFLSMFPEYEDFFDSVLDKIDFFIMNLYDEKDSMPSTTDRKNFAMWAKGTSCPPFFFAMFDGKCQNPREWFYSQSLEKRVKLLDKISKA